MTTDELRAELEHAVNDLDRLFGDPLWTERADAGIDIDGSSPQEPIGEAIRALQESIDRLIERSPAADRWKAGYRHAVAPSGSGYRCIFCGGKFEEWPPDSEPCPGSSA